MHHFLGCLCLYFHVYFGKPGAKSKYKLSYLKAVKELFSNFNIDPPCVISPSPVYSAVLSQAVVAFSTVIAFFSWNGMASVLKCCAWFILSKTQPVRSEEAGIPEESVTGSAPSQGSIRLPCSFTPGSTCNKLKHLMPLVILISSTMWLFLSFFYWKPSCFSCTILDISSPSQNKQIKIPKQNQTRKHTPNPKHFCALPFKILPPEITGRGCMALLSHTWFLVLNLFRYELWRKMVKKPQGEMV